MQISLQREKLIEMIPNDAKSIIDLGCGLGHISAFLSNARPDLKICGIDGDEQYIKICKQNFPHIEFRRMMAEDMPNYFEENSLDCVIMSQMIEHLPNVGHVLESIYYVLRPGGSLILSTDNAYRFRALIKALFQSITKTIPEALDWRDIEGGHEWNAHIYSWSPDTMVTLLKINGFMTERFIFCDYGAKGIEKLISHVLPAFRGQIVVKAVKNT